MAASTAAGASAAVRNVFVYGSLIAPEVLTAVINRLPPSTTAVVHNLQERFGEGQNCGLEVSRKAVRSSIPQNHRYSIKRRIYPAVLPLAGDKVTGKILFDLTREELELLDDFEDVEYTKQIVEPTVLDKMPEVNISIAAPLQAYIYVWAKTDDQTLYGDWDYENWRTNHLSEFLTRYFSGADRVLEP